MILFTLYIGVCANKHEWMKTEKVAKLLNTGVVHVPLLLSAAIKTLRLTESFEFAQHGVIYSWKIVYRYLHHMNINIIHDVYDLHYTGHSFINKTQRKLVWCGTVDGGIECRRNQSSVRRMTIMRDFVVYITWYSKSFVRFLPRLGSWKAATLFLLTQFTVNPLTPIVAMGAAIKHPVPDRVKPSFVIFDIRALSALSVRVPGCQKLQMTA